MPAIFQLEFLLANMPIMDIARWITRLTEDLVSDTTQASKEKLMNICTRETKAYHTRRRSAGRNWRECEELMASIIKACTRLKDSHLLRTAIKACASLRPGYRIHGSLAEALHTF